MPSGWGNQLTRQIGEHLVTAELGRRNFAATSFAGNIPDWDLLAADRSGRVIPIQVKAIWDGAWQFDIRKYIDVSLTETEQIVGLPVKLRHPNLVCIYVCLKRISLDEFYLFRLHEIQSRAIKWFKPRRLPAKISSFHWAFRPRDISEFRNRWELIDETFAVAEQIEISR